MVHSKSPIIVQGIPTEPSRTTSIDRYVSSAELYHVKPVKFSDVETYYLLQGLNGPCPLLAVCNVLLLRGIIAIPGGSRDVSFEWVTTQLANLMMDKNTGPDGELSRGSSLDDCLSVLGSLNKGLEVNVRFLSVDGLEETKETSVFKNLGIASYHGWIVSEDDTSAYPYVSRISYNEAVEKVAVCEEIKSGMVSANDFELISKYKEVIQEGEAISNWLSQTSSQLTTDGVIQLNSRMDNGGLAVLFRNNHFSVLHKRDDRLFSLVTDVGFRHSEIVWESLDQVDGDTQYFTQRFLPVLDSDLAANDFEVALRLQYENSANIAQVAEPPPASQPIRRRKKKCTIM